MKLFKLRLFFPPSCPLELSVTSMLIKIIIAPWWESLVSDGHWRQEGYMPYMPWVIHVVYFLLSQESLYPRPQRHGTLDLKQQLPFRAACPSCLQLSDCSSLLVALAWGLNIGGPLPVGSVSDPRGWCAMKGRKIRHPGWEWGFRL